MHVCWVVSIIRHSGFYAEPRACTHKLDLAETGSSIVEAGYCDCWHKLDLAETGSSIVEAGYCDCWQSP